MPQQQPKQQPPLVQQFMASEIPSLEALENAVNMEEEEGLVALLVRVG
jgi:hypothetical protein